MNTPKRLILPILALPMLAVPSICVGGSFAAQMGYAAQGSQDAAEQQQALKLQQQQIEMNAIRLREMQDKEQKDQRSAALNQWVMQVNSSAPRMVDESTRLDGARTTEGKFTYYFTVVSASATEISPQVKSNVATRLRSQACGDASLRSALNSGVAIGYAYRDRDGINVFDVTVLPQDCR